MGLLPSFRGRGPYLIHIPTTRPLTSSVFPLMKHNTSGRRVPGPLKHNMAHHIVTSSLVTRFFVAPRTFPTTYWMRLPSLYQNNRGLVKRKGVHLPHMVTMLWKHTRGFCFILITHSLKRRPPTYPRSNRNCSYRFLCHKIKGIPSNLRNFLARQLFVRYRRILRYNSFVPPLNRPYHGSRILLNLYGHLTIRGLCFGPISYCIPPLR